MVILVIGAAGFVGRNLVENLKNIRDGKNKTRPQIQIDEIIVPDESVTISELEKRCCQIGFVFDLTNLNVMHTNSCDNKSQAICSDELYHLLNRYHNRCPVAKCSYLSSSQVNADSCIDSYESEMRIMDYRFPCISGKWENPDEYSLIGSLCAAVAHDKPYAIKDENEITEVLFIDDFVNEMLDALEGNPHSCEFPTRGSDSSDPTAQWDGLTPQASDIGKYCYCPVTYKVTVGNIIHCLESFKMLNSTFIIPEIPEKSLAYKLYSMYLSYLPKEKVCYPLKMNVDERGVFTELIKTMNNGQVSINIARPGNVRGQHWHNAKWEIFIVVSGHALIQERRIGINPKTGKEYETLEFEVFGHDMKAVIMLPGYAHNIINLEQDKDLVTVMWANESFDSNRPDTFRELV